MTSHIKIIPLSIEHEAGWLSLWTGYQELYHTHISDQVTQLTWSRLIDQSHDSMYGFCAVLDNQVVGIVHIIEHESCWTVQPYAYLQDLFVDPSYRKQGIARRLIEHVYTYCAKKQCDRVYWLTHENNKEAQYLYDRVARRTGFIQYRSQ